MSLLLQATVMAIHQMFEDRIFQLQLFGCHLIALYSLVSSLVTGNYSQVDRLWPILPTVYSWSYVYFEYSMHGLKTDAFYRLLIVTLLVTSWSVRLTFNSWRRGYYQQASEDYRWNYVKEYLNYPQYKLPWHLFNFTFIAVIQNWLLYALTLPLWFIQKYNRHEAFNYLDLGLTFLFVAALAFETFADEQQYEYQTSKQEWLKTKTLPKNTQFSEADFKRGFTTHGLFKYSRHPNFFAELSIWWIVYAFTISSQYRALSQGYVSQVINISILGSSVLTLLFQGSTWLTERISASKYPSYKQYQSQVSKLIPMISTFKTENKKSE